MPSAWPSSSGPDFCSTIRVLMSGNAASCAASVRPAGPQPTIRTSTSSERASGRRQSPGSAASEISGLPGLNPLRWNCMASLASPDAIARLLDGCELAFCCQTASAVSRRDQGATCNQLSTQDEGGPCCLRQRLLNVRPPVAFAWPVPSKFQARFDCCSTVRTAVSPSSFVR